MFTHKPADSIRALGEVELIRKLRDWLGAAAPKSPEGMGDDCAVVDLPKDRQQILTTDSLTFGQHFDDRICARDAGAKLVKRNLSDIAAMGGRPGQALLTLLCGGDLEIEWLEDFIQGVRETCLKYNLPIVGGDISALPDGQFSSVLSLTGYLEYAPLLRSGAEAGDILYVTGTLGGSMIHKHYSFEPRLAEGQWLAQADVCSSMIDVTDGLAKDLRELIPTACAAYLELDKFPLSPEAHQTAAESGCSALEHAFCDGEDYELLFTVKSDTDLGAFERRWNQQFPNTRLTRIGTLDKSEGEAPYLNAATKEALPWVKGFEHLTSND